MRSCWRILFKTSCRLMYTPFPFETHSLANTAPYAQMEVHDFPSFLSMVCEDQEKPKEAGTLKTTAVRSASRVIEFSSLVTLQLCVFAFVNS